MDNLGWKWMEWMGKGEKFSGVVLEEGKGRTSHKQPLQVSCQEIFQGKTSATNNESPLRLELLLEQSQSLIVSPMSAFYFNGYTLLIVFNDKVDLIVALAPIIHLEP